MTTHAYVRNGIPMHAKSLLCRTQTERLQRFTMLETIMKSLRSRGSLAPNIYNSMKRLRAPWAQSRDASSCSTLLNCTTESRASGMVSMETVETERSNPRPRIRYNIHTLFGCNNMLANYYCESVSLLRALTRLSQTESLMSRRERKTGGCKLDLRGLRHTIHYKHRIARHRIAIVVRSSPVRQPRGALFAPLHRAQQCSHHSTALHRYLTASRADLVSCQ